MNPSDKRDESTPRTPVDPTPEMIEAGAIALDDFLWRLDWQAKPIGKGLSKQAVEEIYRAMASKRSTKA